MLCLVSLASSDGARLRPCFGLLGDIGPAPLANGLNILHIVLAQDISICYVLAVGLYMITFDGRFADDPVGGSRQAGATVGCWIASRISVFSKLEFSRPGKLLCLCADISRLCTVPSINFRAQHVMYVKWTDV